MDRHSGLNPGETAGTLQANLLKSSLGGVPATAANPLSPAH